MQKRMSKYSIRTQYTNACTFNIQMQCTCNIQMHVLPSVYDLLFHQINVSKHTWTSKNLYVGILFLVKF